MTAALERRATLHVMVESPPEGAILDDEVRVDGWCVSDTDTPVAIRVRAGDRLVEAAGGGERADVAATFPHLASAARSGAVDGVVEKRS